MVTLVIDNSTCQLQNLPFEVWKDLHKLLSYRINAQTAYFSFARTNVRYLMDKKGSFPSGLLPSVTGYLARESIKYVVIDKRTKPKKTAGMFKLVLK